MISFSLPRFRRLFANDALRVAKSVALSSLALLCLTCALYVGNFEPGDTPTDPPLGVVLFIIYVLCAGLLLTSESFRDMHHPLERYHYLMLPVSNLERFLSRYLLTGPLFVLYALAAFTVMDWVGNLLAGWLKDAAQPLFSPAVPPVSIVLRVYLFLHVIGFLGAIAFRSLNLVKTALATVVVAFSLLVVGYISLRVFYFGAFEWGSFESVAPIHAAVIPLFEATWANWVAALGFATWLLYVAYRCLKAHEVQNGL